MNEESGNIGWGIPEAFAETLAANYELAKAYSKILISYIIELDHDDNYCDHDILRRSCYWAIGRLAQAFPDLAEHARPWLRKGLKDKDEICRGMAAWSLSQLPPDIMDGPAVNHLINENNLTICQFFNGSEMESATVSDLARRVLRSVLL